MRFNLTVALTFILLIMMVATGCISASWGFALGREALTGITQPDTRPTKNIPGHQGNQIRPQEVVILREDDILKKVKAQIEGKGKKSEGDNNKNDKDSSKSSKEDQSLKKDSSQTTKSQIDF